jgi:hypothetical protein
MTNTIPYLYSLDNPHIILSRIHKSSPTEEQSDILDLLVDHHKTPLDLYIRKRQTGFSTTLAFYLVWELLNQKRIFICGQTDQRRKHEFENIKRIIHALPEVKIKTHSANRIVLENGSCISYGDIKDLRGVRMDMVVGLDLKPEQEVYSHTGQMIRVYEREDEQEKQVTV